MLGALSAAQVVSWGVLYYAFAVFMRPIEAELGWSRAQVSAGLSIALFVSAFASVPVGHWLDARGGRALMTAGSVAGCLLLLALSRVHTRPAFYAIWAGLGVVMAMVLYEPAFAVVTTWFVRHRDRALTVLTLVGGLASTVVVPLAAWLLTRYGWRSALSALALLLGATTIPVHAFVLRRSPAAIGQWPDGEPAAVADVATSKDLGPVLAERRFWSLTIAFTLWSLATVAVNVHLVACLTERHYSPMAAGMALALVGLMQLPGRVAFGPMRQALDWRWAVGVVLLVQAVAAGLLAVASGIVALAAFVCLHGMASGMGTLLRASTVAELYGPARYGRVSGVVALFSTCGRALGPIAAAVGVAVWSGYPPTLGALAALLAVAALLVVAPNVEALP